MSLDINQIKATNLFGLEVARGQVQRASGLSRFAFIPTVGSTYETVWEEGGTYAYPSVAVPLTSTSASGATDAGVEITITGLDSNYRIQSETIVLDGTGAKTTTAPFLRINESRVSNGQALVGDVAITNSGTTYSYISAEFGKSMASMYTVPEGYKAYILSGKVSIAKQKEVVAKLMVRQFGGIFTAEGIVGTSGAPYHKDWIIPIYLPAKTDLEVRAKAGATTEIATSFEILLVEQD